ncbi:MAG: UbiH/UbiF/VisC/COQ6 family ubiquinone biosynthesis hydroxylase [Gammaproteobacteria bacterium]|nr:UbiH/UbiF/VisC/COQ6 family ubiquinone biosynthesis hydroxylase [Gammaproteobacteria bacterium]
MTSDFGELIVTKNNEYDVVIIGGGMVGSTLACALGDSQLRVALIEAKPPQKSWPDDSIDLRVSALTQASQRIFTTLQAWSTMEAHRVSPFCKMHVWDATGDGMIQFDSMDAGEETLGHIVENRVVQRALIERLGHFDNVEFICPASYKSVDIGQSQVSIQLDGERVITAKLLVGADGAHSKIRERADITTRGWEYGQKALVTRVRTTLPHQNTAWQRFMPTGPLAFLPLNDGSCSIVWSTTPEHADQLTIMEDAEFVSALEKAFDSKLGAVRSCGPRAAFPLRLQHAITYTCSRIALIGDAAHAIHPLAGQGVNLGLLDAATLAEVLIDACNAGKDIGLSTPLRRYERWRKGDNLLMMASMDAFKRLFGSEEPSLRWARNVGLNIGNRIGPLKNRLMAHAMGTKDDLPKLANGITVNK